MTSRAYKEGHKSIDWSRRIDFQPKVNQYMGAKRSDLPTPMIARDYEAYECPVTGKLIDGRVAHNENLKRTGCRILEKGEQQEVKKYGKKRLEEKIDAAIDKSIEAVAKEFI